MTLLTTSTISKYFIFLAPHFVGFPPSWFLILCVSHPSAFTCFQCSFLGSFLCYLYIWQVFPCDLTHSSGSVTISMLTPKSLFQFRTFLNMLPKYWITCWIFSFDVSEALQTQHNNNEVQPLSLTPYGHHSCISYRTECANSSGQPRNLGIILDSFDSFTSHQSQSLANSTLIIF